MRNWVSMLRPKQWTKNTIVAAAFVFAYWDRARATPLHPSDALTALPAVLLFCAASSAVYIVNDLRDRDADRRHPLKRYRPIAAGTVSPRTARITALLLGLLAVLGGLWLTRAYATVVLAYLALQLVYTYWLKRVALVDVFVIAGGFVLRAIAGAEAFEDVSISPWLLLCTFLLALFLGLCKRRHEKLIGDEAGAAHRASLENYDRLLLDQLIAITSGATIVAYSIYTLWPDTTRKFGSAGLGLTIPFVAFGIFRYLDLVYRKQEGGRPEATLLTDIPLLVDLALYGITVLAVLALG